MSESPDIEAIVAHLGQGGLIGLPTETVYGLAGDPTQAAAVRKIFALKGRPADHPVIVHLSEPEQIKDWAQDIPALAWDLAARFWPGPLTLILPKHARVLDLVTGGHPTVGLRIPAHPVARKVLRAFARRHSGALAAPSANRFGRVSPTKAEHVRAEFGEALPMVLDGGACEVGIESTIIDLSGPRPSVLRPGQLDWQQLQDILGQAVRAPEATAAQPSPTPAPGTLASHYAVSLPTYAQIAPDALPPAQGKCGWIGLERPAKLVGAWELAVLGQDPDRFARGFYQALRRLESLQVEAIYIQRLPNTSAWQGVADRVRRACAAWPMVHPS